MHYTIMVVQSAWEWREWGRIATYKSWIWGKRSLWGGGWCSITFRATIWPLSTRASLPGKYVPPTTYYPLTHIIASCHIHSLPHSQPQAGGVPTLAVVQHRPVALLRERAREGGVREILVCGGDEFGALGTRARLRAIHPHLRLQRGPMWTVRTCLFAQTQIFIQWHEN